MNDSNDAQSNTSQREYAECGHCGYRVQWGLFACRGCGARAVYNDGSLGFYQSLFFGFVAAFLVVQLFTTMLPRTLNSVPVISDIAVASWKYTHGRQAYQKAGLRGEGVSDEQYQQGWDNYREKLEAWKERSPRSAWGIRKPTQREPSPPTYLQKKSVVKKTMAQHGLTKPLLWIGLLAGMVVFWKTTNYFRRPKFEEQIEFIRYYPKN